MESAIHMGGCPNYGPFLGTLNIRCRITIGIQTGAHNFDNHPYNIMRTYWGQNGESNGKENGE